MIPQVRLYGRVMGYASHAQVTAGFRGELERRGLLAGLVGIDADEPPGTPGPTGPTALVGLYTGPLERVDRMLVGTSHERRYAMVAPNSDTLPKPLLWELERVCTHLLVPSEWAATVMRRCLPKMPVIVVPHGLSPEFQRHPEGRQKLVEAFTERKCTIMHFSTSPRQRKGTRLLVEAWNRITRHSMPQTQSRLLLVLDYEAYGRALEWHEDGLNPPNLFMVPQMGLAPRHMAEFLSREAHIVCQPSRGEGFGMVPLEARACGVPVVATACTGHSQHLRPGLPGVVIVPHGPDEPIDDQPGAKAPSITAESIAASLREAMLRWCELEACAVAESERVQAEWSWQRQLQPFFQQLQE